MKNIAIIFAGGSGSRMNSKEAIPKQFLSVHGKPIIVHTIEVFERAKEIDAVIVVCIDNWIPQMEEYKFGFGLKKIRKIVSGGRSSQESIYNGLITAESEFGTKDVVVLIHDGVRPLINEDLIAKNIESVMNFGSAITCSIAAETIVKIDDNQVVLDVPNRDNSRIARAPQSFYLKDILEVHRKAINDGYANAIDSCTLMHHYGRELAILMGPYQNIKITTPEDFYMFRALFDAKENKQIEDI